MKDLLPVENCTGCSACVVCCPQDAIAMEEDSEGFLYPRINPHECNSCGLCIEACPAKNASLVKSSKLPTVYAGWSKDRELLLQSTSGGVFSEIARIVLKEGGVVFGAAYDKTMIVRHIGIETWEDLKALRGSKYVQSDVGVTYRQAEKHLEAGRSVLYSGTTCQIAGLIATIGKDHKNLLTCDLICHGVPSPKVFRMAIDSIEKRKNSKIVDYLFREKSCGWLHPTVRIAFADNTFRYETYTDNHFSLGFLKNIYLRPACYQCPFKPTGSMSDLTLGDFWQLQKYQPSLIHRGGTSAILINTARGREAIKECESYLTLTECPFAFVEKDSDLRKSAKLFSNREAFFKDLERLSFEELTRKYMKPRSALVRYLARIRRVWRKWQDRLIMRFNVDSH